MTPTEEQLPGVERGMAKVGAILKPGIVRALEDHGPIETTYSLLRMTVRCAKLAQITPGEMASALIGSHLDDEVPTVTWPEPPPILEIDRALGKKIADMLVDKSIDRANGVVAHAMASLISIIVHDESEEAARTAMNALQNLAFQVVDATCAAAGDRIEKVLFSHRMKKKEGSNGAG